RKRPAAAAIPRAADVSHAAAGQPVEARQLERGLPQQSQWPYPQSRLFSAGLGIEGRIGEPHTAVRLIPTCWGIRRRQDIERNLEHLEGLTRAAVLVSGLDIPVRLVAIPEGALQGFTDEVFDLDHAEFARECAIDIPGPETDRLGRLARDCNVFIMAQAKAPHADWPDRFFNIGFLVDPDGPP